MPSRRATPAAPTRRRGAGRAPTLRPRRRSAARRVPASRPPPARDAPSPPTPPADTSRSARPGRPASAEIRAWSLHGEWTMRASSSLPQRDLSSAAREVRMGDRELEEGTRLTLEFDKLGRIGARGQRVVPVVLQHADTGAVLFVGYANRE